MKKFLLPLIIVVLIAGSCSAPQQTISNSTPDFEQIKLEKLDEIQKSILKVTCTSYYKNYYYSYPENSNDSIPLESLEYKKNITSNSVAGTGLILQQKLRKQLLLTCYHVFDFEDTLKTYYYDKNKDQTKFISSRSIKSDQYAYVFHKNGTRSVAELIAYDTKNDLALVESSKIEIMFTETAFQSTLGESKMLKLGQEVYLLGYPKGFFVVSKGLVSPTNFKNKFIVDAPFNKGFSGGIAVCFSKEEPIYEYVGMSNSIAYSAENVLAPSEEPQVLDHYKSIPYDGEIYIKELKLINYGLTFVAKSDVIVEFLNAEHYKLKQLGYDLSKFLK